MSDEVIEIIKKKYKIKETPPNIIIYFSFQEVESVTWLQQQGKGVWRIML